MLQAAPLKHPVFSRDFPTSDLVLKINDAY